MAWEWSHTEEAYENVRENIKNVGGDTKMVVYAEWQAWHVNHSDEELDDTSWCGDCYNNVINNPENLPSDIDQVIYDKARNYTTCDEGGFMAWICPYGCHVVPFDGVLP
jgi:hypothetical protein